MISSLKSVILNFRINVKKTYMLVENQKREEYSFKNENELESPIRELPAKSLTELEQFYNEMIQSDNYDEENIAQKE